VVSPRHDGFSAVHSDLRVLIAFARGQNSRSYLLQPPARASRISNSRKGDLSLRRGEQQGSDSDYAGSSFLHHAKLISVKWRASGRFEAYANSVGHLRIAANPMPSWSSCQNYYRAYSDSSRVRLDLREFVSSGIVRWVQPGLGHAALSGDVRTAALEVRSCWETRLALVTALMTPLPD